MHRIILTVSKSIKKCVNQDEKEQNSDKNFTSSIAGSSAGQTERAIAQTSGSGNLYDYFSENLQVISTYTVQV